MEPLDAVKYNCVASSIMNTEMTIDVIDIMVTNPLD